MKTITFKDFEQNFDVFFDDVVENRRHYQIMLEDGRSVMLLPYEEYSWLVDTYKMYMETTDEQEEID